MTKIVMTHCTREECKELEIPYGEYWLCHHEGAKILLKYGEKCHCGTRAEKYNPEVELDAYNGVDERKLKL